MEGFEQAWAVLVRDTSTSEGDELDVVEVLRIFWREEEALGEVQRLRASDPSDDRFYYFEATEVRRRPPDVN